MAFHRLTDQEQRDRDSLAGALHGRYAGFAELPDGRFGVDVVQVDETVKRYTGRNLRQALRLAREGERC